MKTKINQIFPVALILMAAFFTVPMKAQVTIGVNTPPDNYSLLDLVTTNVKKGVHLPRLNTADRDALIPATPADSAAAVGVAVYNTETDCFEVWNGKTWLSLCNNVAAVPAIAVQPREFNWMEMTTDTQFTGVTSPTDPTPILSATISVTATGATAYQWYEYMHNGQDVVATGVGAQTAVYTPAHDRLGMRQYYCVVSNASGSAKSEVADVAVGCGALAMDDSWHTFMCYNLGATHQRIQQQMTSPVNLYQSGHLHAPPVSAAEGNAAVYGDLYQWGRVTDGHQLRTSGNSAQGPYTGTYTGYDAAWPAGSEQIPAGTANWYGLFIPNTTSGNVAGAYDWNNNPTGRNSFLWRPQSVVNTADPCVNHAGGAVDGDGPGVMWRIPTETEWADIWSGGAAITNPLGAAASSIANTWVWQNASVQTNGATNSTAAGYAIKPDGVTITLFLPAAGYRAYADGTLTNAGTQGSYWSSTVYGSTNFSYYLFFNNNTIVPPNFDRRADGNSIRCIAEM